VTIIETNTEDNNYLPLQDNLKRLQNWKTVSHRGFANAKRVTLKI
jgi:hypothetical protein